MTRISADELGNGFVLNGFDYGAQVWVEDGHVLTCGHPDSMRRDGGACCNAFRYAGRPIATVPEAERFPAHLTRRP